MEGMEVSSSLTRLSLSYLRNTLMEVWWGGGGFWSSAWAGERESPSSLLGAERRGPWALGQDLEALPI